MSLFKTITNGMAQAGTSINDNFNKLAQAITSIGDDGTMTVPKLSVDNLGVNGTPAIATKSVTVSNGLTFTFTRVGNEVTFDTGMTAPTTSVPAAYINDVVPTGFMPVVARQINYSAMTTTANSFVSIYATTTNIYMNAPIPANTRPRISGTYTTTDPWPTN